MKIDSGKLMEYRPFFRAMAIAFLVCLLGISGCNSQPSDIGSVTGTVSFKGDPIPEAIISFFPTTGRASIGRTDENGVYTLNYIQGQKGALIGQHKVTIVTKLVAERAYAGSSPDGTPAEKTLSQIGRKEMLPKKYWDRRQTELTATVEAGENQIDFSLAE